MTYRSVITFISTLFLSMTLSGQALAQDRRTVLIGFNATITWFEGWVEEFNNSNPPIVIEASPYAAANLGQVRNWWNENNRSKYYSSYLTPLPTKFTLSRNPTLIGTGIIQLKYDIQDEPTLAALVVVQTLEDRIRVDTKNKNYASANAVCRAQEILMSVKPKPKFQPKACSDTAAERKGGSKGIAR